MIVKNISSEQANESGLKTASWIVMMHNQGTGTFAPSFPTIDEAEEFANAMRLLTNNVAVSEPVPVVKTETIKLYAMGES